MPPPPVYRGSGRDGRASVVLGIQGVKAAHGLIVIFPDCGRGAVALMVFCSLGASPGPAV